MKNISKMDDKARKKLLSDVGSAIKIAKDNGSATYNLAVTLFSMEDILYLKKELIDSGFEVELLKVSGFKVLEVAW